MTLTQHWVRVYTAGLPEQVRARRVDEITNDLHEQLAEAGAADVRQARRSAAGRTVRGAVDDLMWRREVGREMDSSRGLRAALSQAWWAPVAALVVVFDVGFAAAVLADDGSTMPGRVVGPALVLVCATALAIGLSVRVAGAGTPGPHPAPYAAAALVSVAVLASLVAGITVGGPLFLGLAAVTVVASLTVLARSTVRSAGVGDALVLVGTLPALAMFWLVIPALLALAVIVGVLTSRPRTAAAPA